MLKSFKDMTPEERAEHGRIGGIKSGEAKRRKKAMKETLQILLSLPLKNGKALDIEKVKNFASLKGKNISVEEALLITVIQKALKGDIKAFEVVRDTIIDSQKQIEVNVSNAPTEDYLTTLSVALGRREVAGVDENNEPDIE